MMPYHPNSAGHVYPKPKNWFSFQVPNDQDFMTMNNTLLNQRNLIVERSQLFLRYGPKIMDSRALLNSVVRNYKPDEEGSKIRNCVVELICKQFGHYWGLQGKIVIDSQTHYLSGSFSDIFQMNLATSFTKFVRDKPVSQEILSQISPQAQEAIKIALCNAAMYLHNSKPTSDAYKEYVRGNPTSLASGWKGHAVMTTFFHDNNVAYLAYINRGEKKESPRFRDNNENMIIFIIKNPSEIQNVMNELVSVSGRLDAEKIQSRMEFIEGNSAGSIYQLLQLEHLTSIEKKDQKVGNCTWANIKESLHASIFFMLLRQNRHTQGITDQNEAIEYNKMISKELFKQWEMFVKKDSLTQILSLEKRVLSKDVPLSQASLYKLVCEASAKICVKESFKAGELAHAGNEMRYLIKEYLQISKLDLAECAMQNNSLSGERIRKLLIYAEPRSYILTLKENKLVCTFTYMHSYKMIKMIAQREFPENQYKTIGEFVSDPDNKSLGLPLHSDIYTSEDFVLS